MTAQVRFTMPSSARSGLAQLPDGTSACSGLASDAPTEMCSGATLNAWGSPNFNSTVDMKLNVLRESITLMRGEMSQVLRDVSFLRQEMSAAVRPMQHDAAITQTGRWNSAKCDEELQTLVDKIFHMQGTAITNDLSVKAKADIELIVSGAVEVMASNIVESTAAQVRQDLLEPVLNAVNAKRIDVDLQPTVDAIRELHSKVDFQPVLSAIREKTVDVGNIDFAAILREMKVQKTDLRSVLDALGQTQNAVDALRQNKDDNSSAAANLQPVLDAIREVHKQVDFQPVLSAIREKNSDGASVDFEAVLREIKAIERTPPLDVNTVDLGPLISAIQQPILEAMQQMKLDVDLGPMITGIHQSVLAKFDLAPVIAAIREIKAEEIVQPIQSVELRTAEIDFGPVIKEIQRLLAQIDLAPVLAAIQQNGEALESTKNAIEQVPDQVVTTVSKLASKAEVDLSPVLTSLTDITRMNSAFSRVIENLEPVLNAIRQHQSRSGDPAEDTEDVRYRSMAGFCPAKQEQIDLTPVLLAIHNLHKTEFDVSPIVEGINRIASRLDEELLAARAYGKCQTQSDSGNTILAIQKTEDKLLSLLVHERSQDINFDPIICAIQQMKYNVHAQVDVAPILSAVEQIQQSNYELARFIQGCMSPGNRGVATTKLVVQEHPVIEFTDTDGDVITVKLEWSNSAYGINLYRNGELKCNKMDDFTINLESRTFAGGGLRGTFRPDADLEQMVRARDRLFASSKIQAASSASSDISHAQPLVVEKPRSPAPPPPDMSNADGVSRSLPPVRRKWLPFSSSSKS